MKKILLFALVCLAALSASAQISLSVPNDTTTGTTLNKLAKFNTTSSATSVIITATTDTAGAIGIVTAAAGTTNSAVLTISGVAPCVFDNSTTPNDYAQISSTTAGDCHDAGSTRPTSGQIIGTVFGAGGSAGTYNVSLNKDIYPSSAGAAGSTLLNSSGPQTAVTGTGSAANVYTFSIPGGTMSTTSCVRAFAVFQHSSGSASVTYTWSYGGTTFTTSGQTGSGVGQTGFVVCNNGATNSQYITALAPFILGSTIVGTQSGTSAVDTTTSQTLAFQFTVAATDQVTPKMWVVESVH